jgi:Ca2+-binding RTX toxin-like protein
VPFIRLCLAAVIAGLLAAPAAHAADCTYDPALKKVSYTFDWQTAEVPFTVRALGPAPSGAISISTTAAPHQCLGPPGGPDATVTNTDTIEITPASLYPAAAELMTVDLEYPLGPGFTDEGNGSSEIEIVFEKAAVHFTQIQGGPGDDYIRYGQDGINLNANETEGVDADILYATLDSSSGKGTSVVDMYGNGGNDNLSNAGGAGTGYEAFPRQVSRTIDGGSGNDVLVQKADQAKVRGGPGDDAITGDHTIGGGTTTAMYDDAVGDVKVDLSNPGEQAVGGGLGNDTLANIAKVVGGDGNDELKASNTEWNELFGVKGNDRLYGGGHSDNLYGGAGDDQLFGGSEGDILDGEEGDDTIEGNGGPDWLIGDHSDQAGSDVMSGGAGDDRLDAGAGPDELSGGTGGDTLYSGGAESDVVDGGDGKDELLYGSAEFGGPSRGVVVDLAVKAPQDTAGGGLDTIAGVEDVAGTSFKDELYGDSGPNWLSGGPRQNYSSAGDDYLEGRGGDDLLDAEDGSYGGVVLVGDDGNDKLIAGPGPDELYGDDGDDQLDGAGGADYVEGGSGKDDLKGGGGDDALLGGDGNDKLDGQDDNDLLQGDDPGQKGSDTLVGGSGDDELDGLAGSDTLDGGTDDDLVDPGGDEPDTVLGGEGDDFLAYSAEALGGPTAGVRVDLASTGTQDTRGGGLDVIDGFESVAGTDFSDELYGTDDPNIMVGGLGDAGSRSSGSDRIEGRDGDDELITDPESVDAVVLVGGGGTDVLTSGAGDDGLYGGAGNDRLESYAGNDYLEGGPGLDSSRAGQGADRLVATDGERDQLFCGPDLDQVAFDSRLDFLDNECELPPPAVPSGDNGSTSGQKALARFTAANTVSFAADGKGRKRCIRSRSISIKIAQPAGVKISRVLIFVNGKKVRQVSGGGWRHKLKARLTRRRSTVKVQVKARDGRMVTASHTYRRCRRR